MLESRCLVDGNMVRLDALDEVLRFSLGSMVHVALEPDIGNHFSDDDASYAASFGIPFHEIASLKPLSHESGASFLDYFTVKK